MTKISKWSDRNKEVELPLFSGYAFVRLDHASSDRVRVLQTQGVVSFVGVQGIGIPIPDQEIENINTLLASKVSYQERPYLQIGQRVRVTRRGAGWAGRHSGRGKQRSQPGDFGRTDSTIVECAGGRVQRGTDLSFF